MIENIIAWHDILRHLNEADAANKLLDKIEKILDEQFSNLDKKSRFYPIYLNTQALLTYENAKISWEKNSPEYGARLEAASGLIEAALKINPRNDIILEQAIFYYTDLALYAAIALGLAALCWWLRRLCYEVRSLTGALWLTTQSPLDD